MNDTVLEVRDLSTRFFTRYGVVKAVDGVSFSLGRGEVLCLVGESGCGKTATALSILRLIDSPPGRITGGQVSYHGEDLLVCSGERLRQIRGNRIAMVFQDPQTALNPVLTVGDQVSEPLRQHLGLGRRPALERAARLMARVGIPRATDRLKDYPHQFSGGMKQRVMIAAALSCDPEVLIADEPTTALDTTIKAQILDIFRGLQREREMSVLFITHDLGTVAGMADRIIVMYGGRIAESGTALDIFDRPRHPYTRGLLNCLPGIPGQAERLTPIPGTIPSLIDPPAGCIFHPRCPERLPVCSREVPPQITVAGGHRVVCHLYASDRGGNRHGG